jgi:hypothetical protein
MASQAAAGDSPIVGIHSQLAPMLLVAAATLRRGTAVTASTADGYAWVIAIGTPRVARARTHDVPQAFP